MTGVLKTLCVKKLRRKNSEPLYLIRIIPAEGVYYYSNVLHAVSGMLFLFARRQKGSISEEIIIREELNYERKNVGG